MCGQRSDFDTRPDPPLPLRGKPFDTKLRALSENFVAMDVAAIKRMPLGRFDMKTYGPGQGRGMDYILSGQLTESWQRRHNMRRTTLRIDRSALMQTTAGFGKNYGKLRFHQR
jgi:hypothetical protein